MSYPPLPDEIAQKIARARRLEWWTLGLLLIIVVLMYLVMGSSQAMQTAWVEDVLSMVAPALFLGSTFIERRAPTAKYPSAFTGCSRSRFWSPPSRCSASGDSWSTRRRTR